MSDILHKRRQRNLIYQPQIVPDPQTVEDINRSTN